MSGGGAYSGGASFYAGYKGAPNTAPTNGTTGNTYGGGGSGCYSSGLGQTGGAGASGIIIVYEYK